MAEKMSFAKVLGTGVAVQKIDMSQMDEEKSALFVMEFLIKVLVYFPQGIVLSKFNDLFLTVFPSIADKKGYVPLVKQAKEAMKEWEWVLETKTESSSSPQGYYNTIKLNPQKVNSIQNALTDQDYDGWLDIAMNLILAEQKPTSKATPTTLSGFNKFKSKVDGDVPF